MKDILLVEDNKGDGLLFEEELKSRYPGCSIEKAFNGNYAIDLLNDCSKDFHLIVMDLHIPGLDGFQILEHIKKLPRYSLVPVIILSSSANEAEKERVLQMGADIFIEKPFGLDEYPTVVNLIIEKLS